MEEMIRALPDVELLEELDRSHTSFMKDQLHTEAVNRGFIKPADMEDE